MCDQVCACVCVLYFPWIFALSWMCMCVRAVMRACVWECVRIQGIVCLCVCVCACVFVCMRLWGYTSVSQVFMCICGYVCASNLCVCVCLPEQCIQGTVRVWILARAFRQPCTAVCRSLQLKPWTGISPYRNDQLTALHNHHNLLHLPPINNLRRNPPQDVAEALITHASPGGYR